MSKIVIREKRKNPRVNQEVPVELITNESIDKSSGKTKDLSCVGAKVLLDHSLPTQTQYEITLDLPAGPQTFKGIVVRSESIEDNMYEVSFYFNDITMESRSKINDFVKEKWV
jgi:hypothetical protein